MSATPTVTAVTVDLRRMPHSRRHPAVFAQVERLGAGGVVEVVCDYEPWLLRYQLERTWQGAVTWTATASGPLVWRSEVRRAA